MTRAMPLVQSSSGMIHDANCDRIFQDAPSRDPLWPEVPVQRDEIHAIGPYSRCGQCDPDLPEYLPRVATVPKMAGALTQCDVGRVSVLGTISVIAHGASGVQVTFDDGIERTFTPTEQLDFLAGLN